MNTMKGKSGGFSPVSDTGAGNGPALLSGSHEGGLFSQEIPLPGMLRGRFSPHWTSVYIFDTKVNAPI